MLSTWKARARELKREVVALWLASRDPRTPWYAKALAVAIVGYAMSPIDLIPDFIPVLGYLDDLVLIPLGVLLLRSLIAEEVLADARAAATALESRPASWRAGAVIVLVWIGALALALWWLLE